MKALFALFALGIAILLIAGCTAPASPPPIVPTTEPTTVPTAVPDLQPQPTSIVPPVYTVSIQVQKNVVSTNPWISVTFEGGSGLGYATLMEAMVIRSDGVIEEKSAYRPAKGTQILFSGTTRTDRVIVNVSYVDGSSYTVTDVLVPFRNINPT
jgi:PBP1b-binding outer membrane lipoprotein LpoB